jgi:hypothetical protein
MEKTPAQSVTSTSTSTSATKATLIALLLPNANTAFIRNLRTCLWQATGEYTFLSIFPIIPLQWVSSEAKLPHTLHIPSPSVELQIQRKPLVVDKTLFLPVNQLILDPTLDALKQFIARHEEMRNDEKFPAPFPDGGLGVYLGKSSETAQKTIEQFPMLDSTMRIRSVKLGILELESDDSWLTSCRYHLLYVRNLARRTIG